MKDSKTSQVFFGQYTLSEDKSERIMWLTNNLFWEKVIRPLNNFSLSRFMYSVMSFSLIHII